MKYSLLDAFLVWLGPLAMTGLILGFVAVLLIACILLDKWALRNEANRKPTDQYDVPDGVEVVGKEGFVKISPEAMERYNAYLKEVRRLEALRACSQKSKTKKKTLP